jgi:formate dehydrogenase alpha subunit
VKVITTCPFCGCGCGVVLEVENNQVIAASPQRAHPVSRGTLCAKGWNGHQIVHHDKRLTQPLIRENGAFKAVSWKQALGYVAERLSETRAKQGAQAIGVVGSTKCTNEENYLLGKFARAVLSTNNLDTSARFYHAPTMHALTPVLDYGAATCSIPDLESADAVLIFGANAKQQTANVGSFILQACKKGVPCLLVDPREIEHSRFMTLQLKVKPGTDFILINALIRTIIEHDWQDPDAPDVGKLKAEVEKFTPEYAERETGVPAADLVKAAEVFANASKGMVLYNSGLTQQADGTANVQALFNLALVTGNLGKPGAGIMPLMPSNNMQGALDMGLMPEFLPGHRAFSDAKARADLEKVWHCSLPAKSGLSLQEMIDASGKDIHALYIVGENLAWSAPDSLRAVEKLSRLEFLVVQDLFLTETAQMAHVVLPAASYAEKEGTFTSTERRIQRVRKAIEPIRESRPDSQIIGALAAQMGASFSYKTTKDIFTELSRVVPAYSSLNYEKLETPGGMQWSIDGDDLKNGKTAKAYVSVSRPDAENESPDEEFPFTLIVGRSGVHRLTGTLITRSFTLNKEAPVGIVEVNTDDARDLKIRSGWSVKIKTRRGEVTRTVVVTRGVPPKTLFVPIHHKDGLTQSLVSAAMEPQSKIPQMKICAAKLEMV